MSPALLEKESVRAKIDVFDGMPAATELEKFAYESKLPSY